MRLPEGLARFNRIGTNRVMKPLARVSPGLAVVHHLGRRSGRPFETPVLFFRGRKGYVIPLTYGTGRDWVKNVVASGSFTATHTGRTLECTAPEVVTDPDTVKQLAAPLDRLLGGLHLEGFLVSQPGR